MCKNGFVCGIDLDVNMGKTSVKHLDDYKRVTDITTNDTNNNYNKFKENTSEKKQNFENFDNNNTIDKMVNTIHKMVDMIDKTVDTINETRKMIELANKMQEVTDKLGDNASGMAKMNKMTQDASEHQTKWPKTLARQTKQKTKQPKQSTTTLTKQKQCSADGQCR